MSVINNVNINTNIEKILSYIKLHNADSQLQAKQLGDNCKGVASHEFNGVSTAEIPIIQRILNISDHITFHTHISYFFLIIAAKVAAISGKLVPAAIIVAQIAHSDTQIAVAT